MMVGQGKPWPNTVNPASQVAPGVQVESTRLAVGLRWKFESKEDGKVGSCQTGVTVDDSTGSPNSKKPAIHSY